MIAADSISVQADTRSVPQLLMSSTGQALRTGICDSNLYIPVYRNGERDFCPTIRTPVSSDRVASIPRLDDLPDAQRNQDRRWLGGPPVQQLVGLSILPLYPSLQSILPSSTTVPSSVHQAYTSFVSSITETVRYEVAG